MKFKEYIYEKTILYNAVEKGNIDIIKLLISIPELDINAKNVFLKK